MHSVLVEPHTPQRIGTADSAASARGLEALGSSLGSPIWKPVYNRGETVRFGFDLDSLSEPETPWSQPRVVYLQNTSDPVTWWSGDMLLGRPAWMEQPTGPGISTKMRYYPVATFFRVTVDLMLGLGAPPGYGHRYGVSQAEAWSLIIPPEGWTTDDTRRLVGVVEAQA